LVSPSPSPVRSLVPLFHHHTFLRPSFGFAKSFFCSPLSVLRARVAGRPTAFPVCLTKLSVPVSPALLGPYSVWVLLTPLAIHNFHLPYLSGMVFFPRCGMLHCPGNSRFLRDGISVFEEPFSHLLGEAFCWWALISELLIDLKKEYPPENPPRRPLPSPPHSYFSRGSTRTIATVACGEGSLVTFRALRSCSVSDGHLPFRKC